MIEDGIQFNLPKNKSSVIKVIGVGGGGSNAQPHEKCWRKRRGLYHL